MSVSSRLIRRRLRSVGNTKKITKAMELVAAAKMRRAVAAALKTRAYAKLAWGMVEALQSADGEELHPLLRGSVSTSLRGAAGDEAISRDTLGQRVLYVVMASDRGLCGGFNAALFRELLQDVQSLRHFEGARAAERSHTMGGGSLEMTNKSEKTRWVAIGKKSEQFIRRQRWNLIASFTNLSAAPTVAELRPIAKMAMDAFINSAVDEVRIAFTDFISSLRQQPRVKILLPLQRFEEIGISKERTGVEPTPAPTSRGAVEFLFEPDPRSVLDAMLPRLTELQIYQALLETGASEHSARMLAMRNASDSAGEMINDLTLSLNQARQSSITREIAEISAGRAALTAF